MNRLIAAPLGLLLATLSISAVACGGDNDLSIPSGSIPDLTIPSDLSIPSNLSIPANVEVNDAVINAIVASMEQSGAKVDRDCVKAAFENADISTISADAGNMDPAFIQQFISCITPP